MSDVHQTGETREGPLLQGVRYAHTNLIAHDWARLARFYERVFSCTRVPPERDHAGEWLGRGTGVPGARLRGMHLRLPGWGDAGPTLEIFTYDETLPQGRPVANRAGYAHLAFSVDDVEAARRAVVAEGGEVVGDLVTREVAGIGTLCFAYVRDPEGNIIELKSQRSGEA